MLRAFRVVHGLPQFRLRRKMAQPEANRQVTRERSAYGSHFQPRAENALIQGPRIRLITILLSSCGKYCCRPGHS